MPPVTAPDPVAAFDRTRAALGERYRLERIVGRQRRPGAVRGLRRDAQAAGQPPGQFLPRRAIRGLVPARGARRWDSSTIPPSATCTTRAWWAIWPTGSATGSTARACRRRCERGPRIIPAVLVARARPARRAGARPPAGHHRAADRARLGPGGRERARHHHRPAVQQLHPAGHSGRRRADDADVHGAGGAGRRDGRPGLRRVHRGCAALLRGHGPGTAARHPAGRAAQPSSVPPVPAPSSASCSARSSRRPRTATSRRRRCWRIWRPTRGPSRPGPRR